MKLVEQLTLTYPNQTAKINLINKVNDSIYYIITNKLDFSNEKLGEIYKKRW